VAGDARGAGGAGRLPPRACAAGAAAASGARGGGGSVRQLRLGGSEGREAAVVGAWVRGQAVGVVAAAVATAGSSSGVLYQRYQAAIAAACGSGSWCGRY
jgi:hypothetical protein